MPSRFDPEKAQVRVILDHGTGASDEAGVWVPPDRYRELYEAAEAMAEAAEELAYIVSDMLNGSITDIGPDEEEVEQALEKWEEALATYRGEGES
jgi:acyl-CoA reductase-like NAD-dependent aldehyde dehydrogenase